MPLIVGLGNPGAEYEKTRHNIGFFLLDALAEKTQATFKNGRGPYQITVARHKGTSFHLIKPNTYMNRSGDAVTHACRYYDILPSEILVCYDDIALPTASVRIRKKGSHGGHNGMKDIIAKMGTSEFPRLRFGVGSDFEQGRQADYVLSSFKSEEQESVAESITLGVDAILCFVREGIEKTMNLYNKKT